LQYLLVRQQSRPQLCLVDVMHGNARVDKHLPAAWHARFVSIIAPMMIPVTTVFLSELFMFIL
jgi:hypothetical protein